MKNEQKKKRSQSSSVNKNKSSNVSGIINFFNSNNFYLPVLGLFVLMVSVIRWRFVGMPLERDEGEYAYIGQLILKGIPPYKEAYNMKLPGIYYMYALILSIFGETYKGIHTGFILMNALTMIFLFYGLKKLFNPMIGVLTAGIYGLMAMSNNFLGFAAHATHFAVFYLSIAIIFIGSYDKNKKPIFALLSGFMFGMAFLMKQQAVYFILLGGIVFLVFQFIDFPKEYVKIARNTAIFSVGVFIPYILVVLLMFTTGNFDKFWFWTVQYASKYASGLPWSSGKQLLSMTFVPIWEEFKWLWLLAMAGIVIVLISKFSLKQKIFAICFVVFAALATTPGFYFRQHYFIVLLPAAACLAAITLDGLGKFIAEKFKLVAIGTTIPIIIFILLFNGVTSAAKYYYSTTDPIALCKAIYGINPFVESVEIANYIRANSNDSDKVAVLGSEPQIPFYAHRKSATGHIYTYGLMEIHPYNVRMQEEMISEIEKCRPKFMVFCNIPFSWLTQPNSPKKIFEWYNKYAQEHYNIVGLVDIPPQGPSTFYWNADAQRNPVNQSSVWIFKRKD